MRTVFPATPSVPPFVFFEATLSDAGLPKLLLEVAESVFNVTTVKQAYLLLKSTSFERVVAGRNVSHVDFTHNMDFSDVSYADFQVIVKAGDDLEAWLMAAEHLNDPSVPDSLRAFFGGVVVVSGSDPAPATAVTPAAAPATPAPGGVTAVPAPNKHSKFWEFFHPKRK